MFNLKRLIAGFILCLEILCVIAEDKDAISNLSERRTSCSDLFRLHQKTISGTYMIDVDGPEGELESFEVYCDMGNGRDSSQVWSVIHHDAEEPTMVVGMEAAGSYSRVVTYRNASIKQLEKLIDDSYSCQQYIKWDCKGAMFGFWFPRDIDSWWVGRGWENQYFWGGAESDSRMCGCHPYCYTSRINSTCNCDANEKLKWLEDSGLLLDKSKLPVLELRFGDTGEANEAGQHTLGPLMCRSEGHKDVFMGSFTAPIIFESPDFPEFYPLPFLRYTWNVKVPPHQGMELIFPEYDVLHWGAYNSVPNCKSIVTVVASHANDGDKMVVFESQRSSPPYFISDGNDMEVNVTLTTCNQDKRLPTGKGFRANFRRVECVGCDGGVGENGKTTTCTGPCAVIASYKYPFPHHWYTNKSVYYEHQWVIQVPNFHLVELKFDDLDLRPVPGINRCIPDGGVISIYDGDTVDEDKHLGSFCNLNRQGVVYSTKDRMTITFEIKLQKVGNGRGFHAMFRAIPVTNAPISVDFKALTNVADGKLARQSSTMERRGANLAVDGNTNALVSGGSCSATNFEKEPWWQVDLQKRFLIYGIEIHNKLQSRRNVFLRNVSWPVGMYGLPMPVSGCPESDGFVWETGTRLQDMDYEVPEDEKVYHWSPGLQLKGGKLLKGGVEQHFCIKASDSSNESSDTFWTPGEYCIFQVGSQCPKGFESGYITWVDKRTNGTSTIATRSSTSGTLPQGEYHSHNTTIYFCCRNDGRSDIPIRLPTGKPFFLLQFGKNCQKVKGMSDREQYFHFNEDLPSDTPFSADEFVPEIIKYKDPHPRIDNTLFEKGLALYYCYYDITQSLRGFRILVDDTGIVSSTGSFYDNHNFGIQHTSKFPFLQAYTCFEYPVTEPEFSVLKVNCSQPIYGQYVTLQIYNRYDTLQFCEMKIFGEEACGQPLGMATEEIFNSQLQASSSDDLISHYFTESRLNANDGWCASPSDKQKFLQIDLIKPTTVTGVILQGLNHALRNSFVRTFFLTFSNDSFAWKWEEEPVGEQKVYTCDQCDEDDPTVHISGLSVRYNLMRGITTRYIKLHILTYNESPCLRMEVLGCREKIPCEMTLKENSGSISSPNHPFYYGQDKVCWWTIEPPPTKHVELKFIVYDLAPRENGRRSSRCRDSLSVYTGYKNITVRTPDGINFPKLIISKGTMRINLKTCFRYSLSRFRGFRATYRFVSCPGCGIGDFQCQSTHECGSTCGHIVSFGYPLNYPSNHRCRWLLKASPAHFINVTFHDFDIAGGKDCLHDYIDFYDSPNKENLIGRYCNLKHPPRNVVSSWNSLLIEFSSDTDKNGRGFYLSYKAQKFRLPPELGDLDFDDPSECLAGWKYFNDHCYNVFTEVDTLQWSEAESKCAEKGKDRDGHLVSILNEKEMDVIHYLLTAVWRKPKQTLYIGLKDAQLEGIYRWSDGNPMSYTDWAQTSKDLPSQPDGGTFQDCTMLRVDSGHSTAQWHDIPCSLGKHSVMFNGSVMWGDEPQHGSVAGGTVATVMSYICKMESERRVGDYDKERNALHLELLLLKTEKDKEHQYFTCAQSEELISIVFVCDGVKDCKDLSDEDKCGQNVRPNGNKCPESSYRCKNGRCVSMSLYCDFQDDCGDYSDEVFCDHLNCTESEFRCINGQCIPLDQRCDLRVDCKDKSDEEGCGGHCNPKKTFQCFDGTCIPLYAPCDGRRDCPGKYHEDEPAGCFREEDRLGEEEETFSCANLARKSCQDIYKLDGTRTSGVYLIDPDEAEGPIMPFKVNCSMGDSIDKVKTVVHHDSEEKIYVRAKVDGPGVYSRSIAYDTGLEEMLALIQVSERCRQFIRWDCMGTRFAFASEKPISWWVSRDGLPQYQWGGAKKNTTCGCYPNCVKPELPCNCDGVKRFQWSEDSGYIEDKDLLPIQQVFFGNTYKAGQEGYHTIGPLECSGRVWSPSDKCTTDTNYIKCQSGHYISMEFKCLFQFDQYGFEQGCRDVTHLRDCEDFDCPKQYVKCPNSYCIPPRYLCDGKWDCVEGADEQDCESYSCPGHYRCRNSTICLTTQELCDGIFHCPLQDDELLCDTVCPSRCRCVGLYVTCRNEKHHTLPELLPKRLKKLDFSYNYLNLSNAAFDTFTSLAELSLRHNDITLLPSFKFKGLRNLYLLDLRDNRIAAIEDKAFFGLNKLKYLYLDQNHELKRIVPGAFIGLSNLPSLNISGANISTLTKDIFKGLENTETLIIRNNGIRYVESGAFWGLPAVTLLDIQENTIESFPTSMFAGLDSLTFLYSDSFKFCCLTSKDKIASENCWPPADEISDCEDLMGSPFQRALIWVLGVVALLGNLFVVVWRIKTTDTNPVSSTLILSLGCADFLMGIYLIVIASVDEHYRGSYMQISDQWRRSALCKFCGILSTLSSEVSVFTLVIITIDRLLCISFPFAKRHLTLRFTYQVIIVSWILALILATVPLIFQQYFQGEFYSRSGVCLALHITNQKPAGWEYSVAIFFCVNLVAFVIIVSAYSYMYFTVRKSYLSVNRMKAHRVMEGRIAQQMAVIVMSNFLCWFPIIMMGLMAMSGMKVPGQAYAWTAVFVLPLNSATNPLIYTISTLHCRTVITKFRLSGSTWKTYTSNSQTSQLASSANGGPNTRWTFRESFLIEQTFKPPHGYMPLFQYLRCCQKLSARLLLQITTSITRRVQELHAEGFACGRLSGDTIFVTTETLRLPKFQVYVADFYAYKVNAITSDDLVQDIEDLGIIVKKMLRMYHVTSRLVRAKSVSH